MFLQSQSISASDAMAGAVGDADAVGDASASILGPSILSCLARSRIRSSHGPTTDRITLWSSETAITFRFVPPMFWASVFSLWSGAVTQTRPALIVVGSPRERVND